MDEAFGWELVDRCAYAVMSTVLPDGAPYGVPLSIARLDGHIYFHCASEGRKLEALRHNARVSLVCVGQVKPLKDDFTTEFESVVLTGEARRVEEEDEKIRALRAISLRYTPENMARFDQAIQESLHRTDVWRIRVDSLTAKRKKYDTEGREIKSP